MHFAVVQHLRAPLDVVESVFVDPKFITESGTLEPKLGSPELLDQREDGDKLHQRVRYRFVGHLSPVVTRVIDPSRLTWVEEVTLDRSTHRTTWKIQPDNYANLLTASGEFVLSPAGPDATERRVEGDVKVRVPLVGRKAEAAIVSGLLEHVRTEEDMVNRWIAGQRNG
jgi:hypothetical protein